MDFRGNLIVEACLDCVVFRPIVNETIHLEVDSIVDKDIKFVMGGIMSDVSLIVNLLVSRSRCRRQQHQN
jgi:hypothetical protein